MKTFLILFISSMLLQVGVLSQKIEIVRENNQVYLLDKTGKSPQKVQYNYIYSCNFSKDFIIAKKKDYFLVNLSTAKIVHLDEAFEDLKMLGDTSMIDQHELFRFYEKGKVGLLKIPDKVVIPAEYSEIYPKSGFRSFFLLVKGKNWQFYYPQTGKFSISFKTDDLSRFYLDNGMSYLSDNEAVLVKSGENYHLMKTDGTDFKLDKFFSKSKNLAIEGMSMIVATKDGKSGYIDDKANVQVPFKYEWAEPMEGSAIVKENGKYGLIRDNGVQVIPCFYDKIVRESPELYQAIKDGKMVKLLDTGNPYDNLYPQEENGKYIFATEDKSIKMQGTFDAAKHFMYGIAAVKAGSKWGYIIPTGYYLIPCQFENAEQFNANGVAPAKVNGKWGIINFSGKFVCPAEFDSINANDDNVIKLINTTGIYEFGKDFKLNLITPIAEKGSMTDPRDGKSYQTVRIGSQTWMAQNLKYKTDESWCYDNNESNEKEYGRLYTWKAALIACPAGWHLPSDDEWKVLEKTIGMPDGELNSTDYTRGRKFASELQIGSSIGFDIQLAGFLHGYDKNFYKLNEVCITWTSTPNGADYAYTRSFYASKDMLSRDNNTYVKYGLPVRCLKD